MFLRETHSYDNLEESWKKDCHSEHVHFSHGTSVARGVCTILPHFANIEIYNKISDSNGHFLLLHVMISNMELILVNIYAPTKDKTKALGHRAECILCKISLCAFD